MSGQVIQDWEPLDHPLVTQLTVHCNYVIVNTVDTLASLLYQDTTKYYPKYYQNIALLDPDPGTLLNLDPVWIRIHNTDCRGTKNKKLHLLLTLKK